MILQDFQILRWLSTRQSGSAAMRSGVVLLMIAAWTNASFAQVALPSTSWWWADAAAPPWTNKPLESIRAAAEAGDSVAQYHYGYACFVGVGRGRDIGESVIWTRRSADQKYAPAEFVVGRFYYNGVGVQENYSMGFEWISRAAKQGHPLGMGVLGRAYQFGEGIPRDGVKAREWLHRSLDAGLSQAPMWLGEFHATGGAGTARRTNHVEAFQWYERAASNGLIAAMLTVSDLCRKGRGNPPDDTRAVYWARVAADKGNPGGLETLAALYSDGLAEPRAPDDTPARLLRRAADIRAHASMGTNAYPWSFHPSWALINDCRQLWSRYRFGIGTPRDYVAAAEWMWVAFQEDLRRVAAGQGSVSDRERAENPFDPILNGSVTPLTADERLWYESVRLIDAALNKGRAEAWHQIGESYRDGGRLTPKQPSMSWSWFARAAELGHAPARAALTNLEGMLTSEELLSAKGLWVPPILEQQR